MTALKIKSTSVLIIRFFVVSLSLHSMQRPSRDQLQLMLGKLNGKKHAIEVMIDSINSPENAIDKSVSKLEGDLEESKLAAKDNVTEYMTDLFNCVSDSSGISKNCSNYYTMRGNATNAVLLEAIAYSSYQYASSFKSGSGNELVEQLVKEKVSYETQIRKISALLSESSPYLGGILDASPLAIANLSDSYRDDQWLQFEYDSESSYENENEEKTSLSVTAHMHFGGFFFGGGADYSHTKQTDDYNQKLANSKMRVKGELLRVGIKRPWFKPEVFQNPEITYVSNLNQ